MSLCAALWAGAAPGARQGEAVLHKVTVQLGTAPAKSGQVVLGKRWSPDKRGEAQEEQGCTDTATGERKAEKLLQVNPLRWTWLELPGHCLKGFKNAAEGWGCPSEVQLCSSVW